MSRRSNTMGLSISKMLSSFFERKHLRILMVGLDGAGKTTILYKLKLGEVITSIPTIGFNVETVEYKNIRFTVWDIGGQDRIRPLWKRYFRNTDGIIYVIDSTDTERLNDATIELSNILSDEELRHTSLLVFANKQDLPSAMKPSELVGRLRLDEQVGRSWYVQSACATLSHGLYEGLEWLSHELAKR